VKRLPAGILWQAISPLIVAMQLAGAVSGSAQTTTSATRAAATGPAAATRPAGGIDNPSFNLLKGRNVEAIRIVGNYQVSSAIIMNQVRTREGEPFDPATTEDDYKRIYDLKRFANVEAKVEATETGVIISFIVQEQKQFKAIAYKGNTHIDTLDLKEVVDLKPGESIDPFRVSLAKQAIERLYHDRNYSYVQVSVSDDTLAKTGELVFDIVEGQKVRVRRIAFEGNASFSNFRLRGEVKTDYYIWIFRAGQLEYDQLDDDVASVRKFYEQKGYFDVRVGRKLMVSADQTEVQVTFVIDEGVRYKIDKVVFNGVAAVKESELRADLKLQEGSFYDGEIVQRDIRAIVKAYSPYGYVYQAPPAPPNPEYLSVESRNPVFHKEAGKLDLVYDIHEGKPFHMGRVLIKGNSKTQDKVVLREMHVAPGQLYNSAEINDAVDRLRGLGYFGAVNVTPVGEEPDSRDVLVEVAEGRTASFNIGAGISSNGGLGGEISYEQRNYDIGKWPATWRDMFAEHAFTGAGQTFRASVAPSTVGTSASVRFTDPYLLDQPYIFSDELYYRERVRDVYVETRGGTRASIGKRLSRRWLLSLGGRVEDVKISDLEDPIDERAWEIRDFEGHTTVTGIGPTLRYDSTNRGPLLYRGVVAQAGYERVGGLGGQVTFDKFTTSLDSYYTLIEDLFDRKTVLSLHGDAGYIDDSDAPMFERFYAGGLGSVRGFKYRGISPRMAPSKILDPATGKMVFDPNGHDVVSSDGDAVGGSFSLTTSAEVSYPIYADMLRGVFFIDGGTVERDVEIGTYRVAVGFGFRIILPFAQGAPLALDFGFPIKKASGDDTQLISFSFGMSY